MDYSVSKNDKPHAVCIPYSAQGHITSMLNLAKLLHHRDFQFKTIPDGLSYSEANSTQDIPTFCESITKNCSAPLCDLISQLNLIASASIAIPPVSCLVSDATMFFSVLVANQFKIPYALFFTGSACGYLVIHNILSS
ncbi:unnamed protein product [Citrullus colocynthis]|uniref:Uncharacterized protein n=1 Tax=Citrullus colocynthis TaxID=252529 RepID=A0ABP0XQF1_9ROSI